VVDLHCHILPGVDDGPEDAQGSIDLARGLVQDGVQTVAATPHLRSDHPRVVPRELARRCDDLQGLLGREGVDLRVVPAGEIDLVWAHDSSADDLRLASYGQRGTDLLIETPYGPLPPVFDRLLLRLAERGFRLLLAHPERNPSFQRDPARVARLVGQGVLVQVTAASLVGDPERSPTRLLARRLVLDGMSHVISTDAHGPRAPGRAALSMGAAAVDEIAPGYGSWMVTDAPAAVLRGEPLSAPTVRRDRRRRLFGRERSTG
jgi:protein-tyrosine phosphatase